MQDSKLLEEEILCQQCMASIPFREMWPKQYTTYTSSHFAHTHTSVARLPSQWYVVVIKCTFVGVGYNACKSRERVWAKYKSALHWRDGVIGTTPERYFFRVHTPHRWILLLVQVCFIPAWFFSSSAIIFKSGCFVQKYWSGTVVRKTVRIQ